MGQVPEGGGGRGARRPRELAVQELRGEVQGEEMTPRVRTLGLIWLAVAVVLEFGSTQGGDASILWGWVLLVWTAPFSIAYQFLLYDVVSGFANRPIAQLIGAFFEVGLGYVFWFVMLPRIWPRVAARNLNS